MTTKRVYQERSFSEAEKRGLIEFVNTELHTNIDPTTDDIFEEIKPGVLFCELIETIAPGTLTSKINKDPKNQFEMNENHDQALEGSKKLGCSIINVGPHDIVEGRKHLVLGVFWQIVRVGLLRQVANLSAKFNADLALGLPPEQILLMWLNHHLKVAEVNRVVTNFGDDLKDGEVLAHVLNQLNSKECDLSVLEIEDLEQRAEGVLVNAGKLGCRKFISAEDIVKGNARVNLAFVATLFSKYPEMGLTGRALQLFEENKKLKTMCEQISKELSEERYAKAELEDNLLTDIEKLKEEIENDRQLATTEIGGLNKAIEQEQQEKSEAQEKYMSYIASLQKELKQEQKEKKKMRKQMEALQLELEKERKERKEELDAERQLRAEMEARLEGEKEALQEHNQYLTEKLNAALQRVAKLEAKVKYLKAKIVQLNGELETLNQNLASSKTGTEVLEGEHKLVVEELAQTKNKLKASGLMIKRQEKEIATLYLELGDVKTELLKTVDALGLIEGQKANLTKLLENDQKVGYLQKKSPNTKLGIKLQKRYFVLCGGNLYYYTSDKEYNEGNRAHPKGVIPLDNITINMYSDEQSKKETGVLHTWEIKNIETERIFILIAPSHEEKIIWCDLLDKATGIAKARSHTTLQKTPSTIAESALARLRNMGAFQRGVVNKNQGEDEPGSDDTILESDELELSPGREKPNMNTRIAARRAGNFTKLVIDKYEGDVEGTPSPTSTQTTNETIAEENLDPEVETSELKSPRTQVKKSKK